MRTIAILRHGEAEYGLDDDASRVLTDNGIHNSYEAAKTLHKALSLNGNSLDAIFYSPFTRTQQTAKAVFDTLALLNNKAIHLAPNNHLLGDNIPHRVCHWLDLLPYKNVLLISHQPLVSCLLDWMVQGTDSFKLGGTDNFPFFPSSLAITTAEVIAQGCAELDSLSHHPAH